MLMKQITKLSINSKYYANNNLRNTNKNCLYVIDNGLHLKIWTSTDLHKCML